VPQIEGSTAKKLVSKSVAALLAHAGFDATSRSVLSTFSDSLENYMKKMVDMLRIAVDQGANSGATGFPVRIHFILNFNAENILCTT